MAADPKRALAEFVIREALEPVLDATPAGRPEADQRALRHVQEATRAEIARYCKYGSAEEVVTNFKRDLTSSAAKKVHAELARLQLPTLPGIREKFEANAHALGIEGRP